MRYDKEKNIGNYMLEQYQTEVFALIALLVVMLIYIMMKRKNSPKEESADTIEDSEELTQLEIDEPKIVVDEYDVQPKETLVEKESPREMVETQEEAPSDDLSGREEGTFGETPKQRQADNTPDIEPIHHIHKRDIPPHDKITKDNFKEFAGNKILVAEDNLINQKVIKGLLADSGIEITIADDGQEALDILEKDSDFLLVLMDAHMPRVDGFEATRAIRANSDYDHILVVALSGDTAADDIKKMTEAGMSEQLEKPLRMEALYDIFYAYTGDDSKDESENEDSDYVHTYVTNELDGDHGLDICGGDEDFYHEILDEFIATYESSTQELGDLLRSGKLHEADRLLLDLVGVTANIGAKNLNEISRIIKASLNDTTEKSYLTLIDQYKTSLENLIRDIKKYK